MFDYTSFPTEFLSKVITVESICIIRAIYQGFFCTVSVSFIKVYQIPI